MRGVRALRRAGLSMASCRSGGSSPDSMLLDDENFGA